MAKYQRLSRFITIGSIASSSLLAACDGTNTTQSSAPMASGGATNVGSDGCFSCAKPKCESQASACESSPACVSLAKCILGCGSTDLTCQNQCATAAANDANAAVAAANYVACAALQCPTACVPGGTNLGGVGGSTSLGVGGSSPGSGGSSTATGGTTQSGNGGSSTATGGTTSPSNGGSSTATGGTTSPSNGGSSIGSGGTTTSNLGGSSSGGTSAATTPVSGINWLELTDDWADLSSPINAAFNISGAFYAYGDTCASLTWDPVTRCASGTLCTPGASYQNWGVAIGFDFHNTGDTGTPANAKLAWDPSLVNARGIAWRVTGTAPSIKAWVLQMDPKWSGTCTSDSCEISGPPFGRGPTSTTAVDNLYFTSSSNWVRDDWGGSGTNYALKLADTVSLQFKLAAVDAGAQSFNFCISQLGIVY